MAEKNELIKNISFAEAVDIKGMVDYEEGRVVSRTLASKSNINTHCLHLTKKRKSVPTRHLEMPWCRFWMVKQSLTLMGKRFLQLQDKSL